MPIETREIKVSTTSGTDIVDITAQVMEIVTRSEINHGAVTVFVPGSTGALTTIELPPSQCQILNGAEVRASPSQQQILMG